jgi:hypothetical protein
MSTDETEQAPPSVAAPSATLADERPSSGPRAVMFLVPGLVVGAIGGFVAGVHFGGERVRDEFRSPFSKVTAASSAKAQGSTSSSSAPDPSPPVGTRVLAPFPLAGARAALLAATGADKVVVTVGSVGRSDDGMELHLAIANRGTCAIKSVRGVAYGFDPDGESTAMNADGKHYVAFSSDELALAPGETTTATWKLKHAAMVNVAIGQIDEAVCADGTAAVKR